MGDTLRKYTKKFPVIAAFISVVIAQVLFHFDIWFFHVDFFTDFCHTSPEIDEVIDRVICSVILILLLKYFLKCDLKAVGFKTKNLWAGLKMGLPVLIIPILISGSHFMGNVNNNAGHFLNTPQEKIMVLVVILECLSVGLFEETAYRAVPISILRNKKGLSDRQQLFYCLIISSVFFGLIHLANIIGGYDSFYQGIGRVINAFGVGMVLGAIYWCTGSLISVMIIHFFWDGISMVLERIYVVEGAYGAQETSASSLIIIVGMNIIYISIALFMLRKKKYNGCAIEAKTLEEQMGE